MRLYLSTWPPNKKEGGGPPGGLQDMRVYLGSQNKGDADMVALGENPPSKRPLRILMSWHYYRKDNIDELLSKYFGDLQNIELDVFADSGAYSAWSVGQRINPVEYIDWVKRYSHRFSVAAGPDVIGDPEASYRSTARMMKQVTSIPVLPTFHIGEDWDWLDRCCQLDDYIALGGMVKYIRRKKLLAAWLQKAFCKIPEGHRVHGFGLTSWSLLRAFPWYSVDSSSWTAGFRYANLQLFDPKRGRFSAVDMRKGRSLIEHSDLLKSYGLRAGKTQAGNYDRVLLCGACLESWQRAEDWLSHRKPTSVYLVTGKEGAPNHPKGIRKGLDAYGEGGK